MKAYISIFLIVLSFFLLGCTTTMKSDFYNATKGKRDNERTVELNRIMNSWVGKHKRDLIAEWGSPTSTDNDSEGGEILTYKEVIDNVHSYTIVYREENRYSIKLRTFFVNNNGRIYKVSWRGL